MGYAEGMKDQHVLAFGPLELRELKALPAPAHDPDGAAPGRVQRFADYLWGTVERTCADPRAR